MQKREKWVKIHSIEQMAVEVPKVIDPLASDLSAGAYERHRMDLGEQMTVRMKMMMVLLHLHHDELGGLATLSIDSKD